MVGGEIGKEMRRDLNAFQSLFGAVSPPIPTLAGFGGVSFAAFELLYTYCDELNGCNSHQLVSASPLSVFHRQ